MDNILDDIKTNQLEQVGYKGEPITVVCVNQRCGKSYNKDKTITVPLWAFDRGQDYVEYYVAHELAHILSFPEIKVQYALKLRKIGKPINMPWHGRIFMRWFKALCPEHCQHYELNYKPQNAKAAGISRKG